MRTITLTDAEFSLVTKLVDRHRGYHAPSDDEALRAAALSQVLKSTWFDPKDLLAKITGDAFLRRVLGRHLLVQATDTLCRAAAEDAQNSVP